MRLLIERLTPVLTDYVEDFIDFMCGTLGVEERPEVSFVAQTGNASFGHYQPSDGAIVVATEGRHIADTLRTLGHEIVHHKQRESGELDTLPLLELERDANAVVGLAMRDYNQLHPEMYGLDEPLHEEAAVNAAGSGGIAGIGVGPKGEPGIQKKARTRMLTRLLPKKMLKTITSEAIESGPGELRVDEDGPEVSRTKFAGQEVFQVPSEYFHKARLGKAKYAHYKHYVGTDRTGQSIRDFGNRNYGKPIIIQDAATQHMIYLRYGKGR
jgi:hypothetical protein